jgi:hypothetical protein
MCDYDCANFEFKGCPLKEIIMIKYLDQCPSLRLGILIIKMYLDIVSFKYQIPFNPSHHTIEQSD